MKASDILVLSFRQLKERRLRTILTLLAIAVGVTSIIALSAQVEGVKETITKTLGKLGPETVIITARGGTQGFTEADVARVKNLEGVSTVTPMLLVNVKVSGLEDSVNLVGISSFELVDFLGDLRLLDGSIYYDVPAPQALLGYKLAFDEAGQTRYKAGQPILVQIGARQVMMTVVGVLDSYGSSPIIPAENSVFIPLEYVKTFLPSGKYTVIIVKARSTENVAQVVELVGYVFGGRATIMSIKSITDIVVSVISQVNLLLLGIAGTSFIAAGLGTFNIMMISVLERVREIGILKALGMRDKGVLVLYMTQGLLLGGFGSLVGLGLGTATAYALPILLARSFSATPSQGSTTGAGFQGQGLTMGAGRTGNIMTSLTPVISPLYLGIATFISIAVTLLSSAYPAWKASRLHPVEALRYE